MACFWRTRRGWLLALAFAGPLAWFVYLLLSPGVGEGYQAAQHQVLVGWVNFALVPFLGVLALATHLATGNRRAAALALAALAFAAVFPLHRLFSADQNYIPFLFYGTLARAAFAACFLAWPGQGPADPPGARRRNAMLILTLAVAVAVVRYSLKEALDDLAGERMGLALALHYALELGVAVLAGVAAYRLVRAAGRGDTQTSRAMPLAFVLLADLSLFFLVSNPPDPFWWGANLLWGLSNLLLIAAALRTAAEAGRPGWDGGSPVGGTLAGYHVLEPLGEGGMGQVFKARHRRLNRLVALKIIRPEQMARSEAVHRFRREARAAARLEHPNIVQIYDAAEAEGTHFLVMEYVEGRDLAELVKRRGPLPVGLACHYARQAALALAHAHGRGLVHRDIKPANLILTADGTRVKVLDMGVARFERPEEGDSSWGELTETGAVMGTPAYLAPEQARDSRRVDIRGDIYSLGCTLYHLLTGRVPFRGVSLVEVVLSHQLEEPAPIEAVRGDVPEGVRVVLRKMMAKLPQDRYQTPAEAAEALAPFAVRDDEAFAAWTKGEFRVALAPPDASTV